MMKLHYAPFSPYARKCWAFAIECGLEDQLTLIATSPREVPDFGKINPLHRVPALELQDGSTLFDSPVICEYFDWLNKGDKLIPPPGASRWHALKLQAMGDGIMDAAVPRRQESLRPSEQQSPAQLDVYKRSIYQTVDALEKMSAELKQFNIGTLAVTCGLGYLDARFAVDNWRQGRPKLAEWYEKSAARASLLKTAPPKS